LFVPAADTRAGLDAQSKLTADEQRRLHEGELVERRTTRAHGALRLIGGSSFQVIDASPEVVWRAVLDTPYYKRTLPQVTEARVIEDHGATRKIFVRHGSGLIQASYYLNLHIDPPQREVKFRLDESNPHDVRAAFGFYSVRPYPGGRAVLAYGVMADIGDGLGTLLMRSSVHEWMMKVPYMMKRFVEGSGRYIYR
jgi:hypothetical protein